MAETLPQGGLPGAGQGDAGPAERQPICASSELAERGRGVVFDILERGRPARGFVLRIDGAVVGYLNRCAHVPAEMDWQEGQFLDAEGRLTYVGNDGRRYVVGLSPELDEESVERVMAALRQGSSLFQQIEALCHRWIAAVGGGELGPRSALVLLLTTLETALEDEYGDT